MALQHFRHQAARRLSRRLAITDGTPAIFSVALPIAFGVVSLIALRPSTALVPAPFPRALWIGVAVQQPSDQPGVHVGKRRRYLFGCAAAVRPRGRPQPPQVAVVLRVDRARALPPGPGILPTRPPRHQLPSSIDIVAEPGAIYAML